MEEFPFEIWTTASWNLRANALIAGDSCGTAEAEPFPKPKVEKS
jgi:hypothetical protein